MKQHYYLLMLFIAILSCHAEAQRMNKGFLVKLNKDTIYGYLSDKTDSNSDSVIGFKNEKKEKELQQYSTSDLLGFGFDSGRIFERVVFTDSLKDTVRVFAKRILEGRIKMLLWRKNAWTDFDVFLFNCNPERSVHLTEPVKKVIKEENGIEQTIYKINHTGMLNYVMNDTSKITGKSKKVRYAEKKIFQDILSYDQASGEKYPVKIYSEKKKLFFDFTAGMPFINGTGTNFRVAFYANQYAPEKNRNFSLFAGASYRFQKSHDVEVRENQNYQQQWISSIPIGLNIHTSSKIIRPYFYAGIGFSILVSSNYHFLDNGEVGTLTDFLFVPALNIGFGTKIKIGSQFIMAEITPTANYSGIFANLGFSF